MMTKPWYKLRFSKSQCVGKDIRWRKTIEGRFVAIYLPFVAVETLTEESGMEFYVCHSVSGDN
jgi:hypothetical protein